MSATGRRSVAHAGFTLVRDYPVPVGEVWAAFAEEDRKREWFGESLEWETGEWRFDFRVGGRDVAVGAFHGGPVSRFEATYTDIVAPERIVVTYDMWLDDTHISTSVVSYEFEEIEGGTRFTHGEHGIHLDGFDDGSMRERGSEGVLDRLGSFLASRRG
ncbi:SRPBCC domain-containing protein [Microbacterium lushaniae]|uniref:ATPase n=1 Tax=Microbacterium lushaniae TaxID=2614639 RepID=A0A5J6L0F2_9MICO|nr:SRPBCC domain-containing protein [Microbacterium lushaniae]QEW01951.1 ATPase [Microbacterium lushaniae]